MKKFLSLLLAAALCTTVLTGCGEKSKDDETLEIEEEDKGAIIDMYFGQMPDSLDPTQFSVNSDKYQITSLLFEGLTTVDAKGNVKGAGASDWEYEVDERDGDLKLYIKLKSTKWSDSIPVRADDYVFAWKKLLTPSNSNPAASLLYPIRNARKVKSGEVTVADIGVKAVSESILEVIFEEDFEDVNYFLRCLASPMLVPLREDKVKNDEWTRQLDLLVTNGPFCVKSISDGRIIMERSTYYNSLRTRQKLDTYVKPFRIIAYFGDPDEALGHYNDPTDVDTYRYIGEFSKESYTANASKLTTVSDLTAYTYFFNTKNPLLADAETRKALTAALDRSKIAEIRGCGAEAATGLVPTGVHESGSAKDFRAAGGNVLPTGDFKAGKGGTITLIYNADRAYEKEIAEYVKETWKGLGFGVKLNPVTETELATAMKNGEFDVAAADYISYTDDAYGFVAPFALEFSGSYVDVTNPDVFFNPHFTGFEDEEYNALVESLYVADKKDRNTILHNAEKALMDACPVCPLFFEKTSYMATKDLSKIAVDYRGAKDFKNTSLKGYKKINEAKDEAEKAENESAEPTATAE